MATSERGGNRRDGVSLLRTRGGRASRFLRVAAVLVSAVPIGLLAGAVAGAQLQRLLTVAVPRWGSNPPAPWGDVVAVALGLPFVGWAVLRRGRPVRVPAAVLAVLGLSLAGGFAGILRMDPLPPEGLAAPHVLDEVEVAPAFVIDHESFLGNQNVTPYLQLIGPGRAAVRSAVAEVPPGFDVSYSNRHVTTWLGPNPVDEGACKITVSRDDWMDEGRRLWLVVQASCG